MVISDEIRLAGTA